MNLSTLPPCPPAFKSINPYLQRAREMENVDPAISYWCAFHAAQTCMSIGHNEAESREFLMRLLDFLEHAKSKLSENDAITNNLAATAYVENFALKIFDGADKEDREGLSTRTTAQRFLAAACFLEVLQSLTNQPEPDIMQKIKYSKWKAGSIAKAIREGTGLQHNHENIGQPLSPGSVSSSEAIGRILTMDTNAVVATGKMEDDWPKELGTSSSLNKLPSPKAISGSNMNPFSSNTLQSNKPSPFPSTVFPPNQQSNNLNPVGPLPSDFSAGNQSNDNLPNFPNPPAQQTFYSTPSLNTSSINTHNNKKNDMIPISPLPPSSTVESRTVGSSDPSKISKAQKHAKWAISALNFDDVSTAKIQLQVALDTLSSL